MVHTGFRNSSDGWEDARGVTAGWTYYLLNLKSVLENQKDLRHDKDEIFG